MSKKSLKEVFKEYPLINWVAQNECEEWREQFEIYGFTHKPTIDKDFWQRNEYSHVVIKIQSGPIDWGHRKTWKQRIAHRKEGE